MLMMGRMALRGAFSLACSHWAIGLADGDEATVGVGRGLRRHRRRRLCPDRAICV